MANAQRRLGQTKIALANYQRVLRSSKFNIAALYHNIAETWHELGEEVKARQAAKQGLLAAKRNHKNATNRLLKDLLEKILAQ